MPLLSTLVVRLTPLNATLSFLLQKYRYHVEILSATDKSETYKAYLRWNVFIPKLQYLPSSFFFQVYLNVTQAKQIIKFIITSDLPTRGQKESDELSYKRFQYGRSLWSANRLPAQGVRVKIYDLYL